MAGGAGSTHQVGGLAVGGASSRSRDFPGGLAPPDGAARISGFSRADFNRGGFSRQRRLIDKDLPIVEEQVRRGKVAHAHMDHIAWHEVLSQSQLPPAIPKDAHLDGQVLP
jgi:hypothetical protein